MYTHTLHITKVGQGALDQGLGSLGRPAPPEPVAALAL